MKADHLASTLLEHVPLDAIFRRGEHLHRMNMLFESRCLMDGTRLYKYYLSDALLAEREILVAYCHALNES